MPYIKGKPLDYVYETISEIEFEERRERRERIATACLQGILANPQCIDYESDPVGSALAWADELIEALEDKK